MGQPQLLKKLRIAGAPLGSRLIEEIRNRQLAQNFDTRRTDAHHGDQQVLARDLHADAGSDGEPFSKIVRGHWGEEAVSYQRITWNGGSHSGPRNFTMAVTVRRRSENWPFERRNRAVARMVAMELGTMPNLGTPPNRSMLRIGAFCRKLTMAAASSGGIPMACITAGGAVLTSICPRDPYTARQPPSPPSRTSVPPPAA